jgi:hypothetical protein
MKDEAVDEKPKGLPMYSIYIDETGKTDQYLSVGSLWIIDGFKSFQASRKMQEWITKREIDFEFHFAKVTNHKLQVYKEFFLMFLTLNPTVGFKTITLDRKGFKDIQKTITDLTFHLIHKGITHEHVSGRAPLPRLLQVWLDEEEKGSDQLKIENLKERITSQKMNDLYLGDFQAVNSEHNFNIQAVDLFTSAINRRVNNPESRKVKDELADYILDLLNFDVKSIDLTNTESDKSKVFNLGYIE